MLLRTLLALVAGVVLSLALEPVALPAVVPLAVAGYVLTVRGLRARSAWLPGLLFGVGFYFTHIVWMRAVGTDAWIALSSVEALFYGLLGPVTASLARRRLWPLWVAAAWVAMEAIRSTWPFSGMPWGRLAFAVVDTPVADALPYLGSTGVSFVLALAAAPALASYGPTVRGHATVAAVQGDVPGNGDDILYDFRQVTQNHVDATVGLAADVAAGRVPRPDFVVWPENSTAVDPFLDDTTNQQIWAASAAVGLPILVGAIVDAGPRNVLNEGIVWDPVTGAGDRYAKWHPVPYGEYIPFRSLFAGNFGRLALIPRDMLAGTRTEPLRIGGVEVGDAICFDVAYDDGLYAQLRRGAQLLTVQTSNATFIHTTQIDQQFAISRLRALETGRYVVVAATNGVSGVIAPDGTVLDRAGVRTRDVLVQRVALSTDLTPAVRIGAWSGRLCVLVAGIGVGLGLVDYRRRSPAGDRSRPVPPGVCHPDETKAAL